MKQRISVRIRIISGDRVLLVRRAIGRESILGKYELPGGRVGNQEQPEDAVRRFLLEDVGIRETTHMHLDDVMTYIDGDDKSIQYAVIVYRVMIGVTKRAVRLSSSYDRFVWYTSGKIEPSIITDVSKLVLGAIPLPVAARDVPSDIIKNNDRGVVVYTDGGSRGNPGPSAAGYVVIDKGELIDQGGEYLGITTNNQAEYHGVRLGLEAALRLGIEKVEFRVDSMLVVNQLNNIYKIKNRELWPVNQRVHELMGQFKQIKFVHIPRGLNQLADGMVNRTLDRHNNML